ncbi:unnamed protein product, partial [Sphenostylis stenocarpa]
CLVGEEIKYPSLGAVHSQLLLIPPGSLAISDRFCPWLLPFELTFFYSLPPPHSDPTFFFANVVPKLKTSLSHTLHYFLPLAGNIVWPSDSPKPIVQFTPGDAVSVVVTESDAEFNHEINYSPREAARSHPLVPHLHSSDSIASVMCFQITLFPNKGFSIGMSTQHAVLDGKSAVMFIKAWASLCRSQTNDDTQILPLVPELQPSFERSLIKEPTHVRAYFKQKCDERCLRSRPSPPVAKDAVRAKFVLTRGDLEIIKRRILSKWDLVEESKSTVSSKPSTLSSFVITCAYVTVCIAKAVHGIDREKKKFAFGFAADWRFRLEPRIPDNYCGNCVWNSLVNAEPLDYIKKEGVVIVAKHIHRKVKMLDEGPVFDGLSQIVEFLRQEDVQIIGVTMSNRFGVYDTDFGWGKPAEVEITSLDRSTCPCIGLAESKDGSGGVEVELVMNKHVMDLFATLFRQGLCDDD